jgi:hypothetical protein
LTIVSSIDEQGVTKAFILEGVDVAGRTLGTEAAKVLNQSNFEYVNRWNVKAGRHEVRRRFLFSFAPPVVV